MLQGLVDSFMARKPELLAKFDTHLGYSDILKRMIEVIGEGVDDYDAPDPERITVINDGDYQGTILFVIGAKGYQPYKYYYTKVSYGSCSGCDTLQAVNEDFSFYEDTPEEEKVEKKAGLADAYWTLALHMLQGMKEI